jgi:hypothetical protein
MIIVRHYIRSGFFTTIALTASPQRSSGHADDGHVSHGGMAEDRFSTSAG